MSSNQVPGGDVEQDPCLSFAAGKGIRGEEELPVTRINAEKKLTRRNFLKKGILAAAGLFVLGLPGYSFFVEKNQLEINRIRISSPRLPVSFKGMKIVQISDLHFGFFYGPEQLQTLVDQVRSLHPDLFCFTGDLIDRRFSRGEAIKVSDLLKQIDAPYGKFAILGNHDYWGDTALVKDCLTSAGFRLLINEWTLVKKGNDVISVSGLDDLLNGKPDHSKVFNDARFDPDLFHLMLVHEPDFAKVISSDPVDLQLSGHSHGGQINLPFFGPLFTPPLSRKFSSGLYQINERLTLYTNRSIGTTILPFRFACRPEITVIELG